jgi:exonuclease V gamma subunit
VEASACFVENATRKNTAYKSVLRIGQPPLIDVITAQTREQLRQGLHSLIAARESALAQPLLFPGKTAWAWANADAGRRDFAARTAWSGGYNSTGERDFGGGYANLLVRNLDFVEAGSAAHARFAATVELVAQVLDPQRRILLPLQGAAQGEAAEESQDDA